MSTLLERDDLTISLDDVEPLGIVPMKASNGGLVEIEFEEILRANHGITPLAIIKDHGSDIHCGGRLFCEAHPGVINIDEIPHKIARLYFHQLRDDESWEKFTKKCANFKKQVQLTEYSDLAPPNQRSKARYHNIDVLVDWAIDEISNFGDLSPAKQKKLSWLRTYESELKRWNQFVEVGRVTRNLVRKKGLWLGCQDQLSEALVKMELCPNAEQLACDLIDFVQEQGDKVPEGKRVIGSSEIIESMFGKHKRVSEKGPKAMGRLILSMASRVGDPPTEPLVETAFEQVQEKHVNEWLKKAFA